MLLSILAVNRFACFNPFHRIDPVFGLNWTVNGQYETPPKNRPQAIATPSICPCSVLNCSRPNSDPHRIGVRFSVDPPRESVLFWQSSHTPRSYFGERVGLRDRLVFPKLLDENLRFSS